MSTDRLLILNFTPCQNIKNATFKTYFCSNFYIPKLWHDYNDSYLTTIHNGLGIGYKQPINTALMQLKLP